MGQNGSVGRETLPIPDRPHIGLITYDAKDPETAFPPIEPLRPPAGAPNVLVVLIDDCGFGASSAFGGPVSTPTAERLAAQGLKYNRFHTTALCSPTRAALLSGRNHHAVGMGGITEIATSAPGYNSLRPKSAAPLAETLKLRPAVSFEADQAASVLPDPDVVVVPIVAVHGAQVPRGKVVVDGVLVVSARRLPSMLRRLPAVLGPERVAAAADQARVRLHATA